MITFLCVAVIVISLLVFCACIRSGQISEMERKEGRE